jgi:biotin transporter BioY
VPTGKVQPPDPPMVPFAVVGIAIWAVLGLALLPLHGWLSRHGHLNWLWTCVAGFLLGFVGLAVMIRHDRRRRERRAAPPVRDGVSPGRSQP